MMMVNIVKICLIISKSLKNSVFYSMILTALEYSIYHAMDLKDRHSTNTSFDCSRRSHPLLFPYLHPSLTMG